MTTNIYLLALVAYFIGFIFILIIRSYDKYDREPLGRLVLFSFLGGIVSIVVSSFLYVFVHPHLSLTDAILKIGPVEEASKLITLFILYKLIRNDFDEIVDGIIYIAAISLGFSVIENISYALHSPHTYILLAKRFLFATIGHISFSVYMGIAFYVHKKIHKNYTGLLFAFILSVLAHGLYDGFIFNKNLSSLFLIVYISLIIWQFRLLKMAYAYSKMKKKFTMNQLVFKQDNNELKCCNCQDNQTKLYEFKNIPIHICDTCRHAIISQTGLNKLLKYFRPKLNRKIFFKTLEYTGADVYLNDDKTLIYHQTFSRLNGHIHDLSAWFKDGNSQDITKYQKTIEGWIFKQLGFKFLKK